MLLGEGEQLLGGLNLPELEYECAERVTGAGDACDSAEARDVIHRLHRLVIRTDALTSWCVSCVFVDLFWLHSKAQRLSTKSHETTRIKIRKIRRPPDRYYSRF